MVSQFGRERARRPPRYAARCAGYAVLTEFSNPWLVLLVEPLHGITFALFYTCGVTCAKRLFPEDRETLAQGLFSAFFTGGTTAGSGAEGSGSSSKSSSSCGGVRSRYTPRSKSTDTATIHHIWAGSDDGGQERQGQKQWLV